MIKVGIIDKDPVARETTQLILSNSVKPIYGEIPLVSVVFDIDCVDNLEKSHIEIKPDIILLDIADCDARIIGRLKSLLPYSEVIILSNSIRVKTVRECFRNGGVSYLRKKTSYKYLVFTVITTYNGGSFISPSISRALIAQDFDNRVQEELLTARELQIANGLIDGLSYKLIADRHAISLDTVRVYVKRIYRKLKINSKGELFAQLTA